MSAMNDDATRAMTHRVTRLVYLAAGGRIAERDLDRHDADLRALGLDSLAYLNLLEGLERVFEVTIDLEQEPDHTFLHTIENIVRFLEKRQGSAA
jgi:acyl carrier protein